MTLTDLILPKRGIAVPEVPSYIKLDMAFGLGSGTTLFDKSRYRSHGTIYGADWAAGLHGYALDFDAASRDYVLILSRYTQVDFTSEKYSIIARIYPTSLATQRFIITRRIASVSGWDFRIQIDGRISAFTTQAGANQQSHSAVGDITTNSWFTVGLSRNGASIRLFVNGVDKTTTAATHIDPATSGALCLIGIYQDGATYPFDGKIEFLRIFGGVALSTSEHLAYHNALA